MQHIMLRDLDVSRIGLGAMGMSFGYTGAGTDDAESTRAIHRALDLGVTFIDTAEVYGPYTNEELVGKALKGRRDEVVLATKFGMISHTGAGPGTLDSSPANIRTAVEGSLRRLGTVGIADEVQQIAADAGATPAQVAIAWLLARGDRFGVGIAPIPGTKRVSRVEENVVADHIELSADQIDALDALTPPQGDHHNEAQLAMIDR